MSSYNDLVSPSTETTSAERFTGRVKWFNNKAGYGFITITDGVRSGTDVFVHHSAISVANQQYKYLVQGEYVEFLISNTQSGTHEFQAANVGGIKSGQLMCETRHEFKTARSSYKTTKDSSLSPQDSDSALEPPKTPRQPRSLNNDTKQTKTRGEGPREGDGKTWTLVTNEKRDNVKKVRAPRNTTKTTEAN